MSSPVVQDSGFESQSASLEDALKSPQIIKSLPRVLGSTAEEVVVNTGSETKLVTQFETTSVSSENQDVREFPETNGEQGSAIPALIPDNMTLEELRAKVKELFPGFKSHGILRFSSLLGPGKPSSLPRVWREAQKPKKKKRKEPAQTCTWTLDVDFEPPPEMVMTSDEVMKLSHRYH